MGVLMIIKWKSSLRIFQPSYNITTIIASMCNYCVVIYSVMHLSMYPILAHFARMLCMHSVTMPILLQNASDTYV